MTSRGGLIALIVTATAALVVGVSLERHETHNEAAETSAQRAAEGNGAATSTAHNEANESHESGKSGGHNDSTETTATATPTAKPATEAPGHSEASETLLGVNPESTGLLAVAVAASLLLAAAVWWLGDWPLVLGVVAPAMAAFGVLDVREVIHQADESRTGLMLLAALVAVLHFAAALLATRAAVAVRRAQPPPASAHAA